MNKITPLLLLIVTFALAVPSWAEKINLPSKELRDIATHIVSGKATAIYKRTENKQGWNYTHYVVEIRVEKCSKGEEIEKGDLVYARYWKRTWFGIGQMPSSTTGHRGLPAEGDSLRVYLARNAYDGFTNVNNDGGFNVIGANGFEKLQQEE